MKKGIVVITAVIVLTAAGSALAQMKDKGGEMMADKAGMMEGKGGMMGGKGGMMGMMGDKGMMGMMNKPSMIAVNDAIIVLSGRKLYKYDADLNLVKEAEIKADDMGMMGGGMMGDGMMGQGAGKPANTPAAPADETDHASHH